jgi:phosphoribosyl 1,2-cyclic phosphate phosphodiesterase
VVRFSSGKIILLDCPPDFRSQVHRANISDLHYVLITHNRPDCIFGLDDLRAFTRKHAISLYASPAHAADLRARFPYAFGDEVITQGGIIPQLRLVAADTTFEIDSIRFDPIPLNSRDEICFGYRFGNFAYLTSGNSVSEEAYAKLIGVELVVLNASSLQESKAHFSFQTACDAIERIQPRKAWFVHISHKATHADAEAWIETARRERPGLAGIEIYPGYDGLVIEGISI